MQKGNKESCQIRLLFEGESPDCSLKEKVKKLIGEETLIRVKFHYEPLNHFIMADDKEALITTSKELGLGESPSLWTNNNTL